MKPGIRHYAATFAGLAAVLTVYAVTQYPKLSPEESAKLAAHFRFTPMPLAEVASHPPYKNVRAVHPSLARISAWVSTLGAAAAFADLDGDGLPNDLVSIDPRTDFVTVAPAPGTGHRYAPFALDAAPLPYDAATTAPMGALMGDFNEDGLLDVLVYFWGRTPVIYLRNGGGTLARGSFTATELVPVAASRESAANLSSTSGGENMAALSRDAATGNYRGERWFSNGAVQGDLDGDGHVDLIIGNYFQDGARILDAKAGGVETMHEGKAKALNGGYKHVFLWQSAKTGASPSVNFTEQTNIFRPEVARGWTLAIGVADLDGDQLPEIYFGHDFGPDRLMHNRSTPGHLQFIELEGQRDFTTPKSCVLGQDSFKGMGCDFGDVNGDGLFDIYVSNIATEFGLTESHFLWQSTGDLASMKNGVAPYFQNSEKLGLSRSGWGWDCRLADFDNDGTLEAIQAVGFIKGKINRWPELQALGTSNSKIVHDPRVWPTFKPGADLSGHDINPFFVRAADGRYYNLASQVGFTEPMVSKGLALADADGDGRLDFVFANQWEPSIYFHNESLQAGAFLGLHLLLPLADAANAPLLERPGHPGLDTAGRPAFGAQAIAHLANGKKILGQIDGGTGHSGRRSPDIHLGLGSVEANQLVRVELKWRDLTGQPQRTELQLKPGWHTVRLGAVKSLAGVALDAIERPVPLTPALSPGERENGSQRADKSERHDFANNLTAIPPLPAGEGRGEGNPRSQAPSTAQTFAQATP